MGWGRGEEGGDEEVVLGVWERGEDVFRESFRAARWVFCLAFFKRVGCVNCLTRLQR